MNIPILGIILGDAAGIGPEIIAKILHLKKWKGKYTPVIIGSKSALESGMAILGVSFEYKLITKMEDLCDLNNEIYLFDDGSFEIGKVELGTTSIQCGKAIISMIFTAVNMFLNGIIGGFTYAPFNKKSINLADSRFKSELDVIKYYCAYDDLCIEMNFVNNLWTARATGHIPLKDVSSQLNIEQILRVFRLTNTSLNSLGFKNPKIFVTALNPHGGEGGLFGTEEISIITPSIQKGNQEGINLYGPYPADTIFHRGFSGECDAIVTMYHDQGQIALKTKNFMQGVTFLAGLPLIVTTASHGVGYDIAGKGIADESSLYLATEVAARMIKGYLI